MIKKYIIIFVSAILLAGVFSYFIVDYNDVKKKYATAIENCKTYESLYDIQLNENREFKLTIDQLNYSKDSVVQKLNEVRKKYNILDKKLKSLSYLESSTHTRDTVLLKDTTILTHGAYLDTTIVNPWYDFHLYLKSPDTLDLSFNVKSVKYIMASHKRETIEPPKKCALARLFQKKHTVVDIQVIEENPYITTDNARFIEIIE